MELSKCRDGGNSVREKLQRFMWGRYGNDQLNKFLLGAALVCMVLSMFRVPGAYLLALALLIYCYFRMFSKNTYKRAAENQWYLNKTYKMRTAIQKQKWEWQQRKEYHIYKCPNCKQKLRIPRGKGKIMVRCRRCGTEFMKKS